MASNTLREEFVKNLNGTSMMEVILLASQLPLLIFVTLFLKLCILNNIRRTLTQNDSNVKPGIVTFLIEFLALALPIVFMVTLWSDLLLLTFMSLVAMICLILTYSVSSPNESVFYWKLPNLRLNKMLSSKYDISGKQPFITYFRSLIFLATTVSILGVDFHVYPRRFAKTETYGVSPMDLGVGLFVISSSIVSNKSGIAFKERFKKTLMESFVFFVLGALRYFFIQRYHYQTHLTEYGVHWNFFITLAFIKLLSVISFSISFRYNVLCGSIILILHQYLLSSSLEDFVLSNKERSDWFSANREGIVSLCGYLSLYLLGSGIRNVICSVHEKQSMTNKLKLLVLIILLAVISCLISYYLHSTVCLVSRRLANISYVIWTVAISLTLLAICLLIELLTVCFLPLRLVYKSSELYGLITPTLLDSVNVNGLLFFLSSNLLTGLINLSIDVYNMNTLGSTLILVVYTLVNCSIVFQLYTRKHFIQLAQKANTRESMSFVDNLREQ